jgi:hypothetical protein
MKRVPLFVEVLESKDNAPLQVCRKIMANLFRQKIAPLPFGSSFDEIRAVLASMRTKGMPPAIFVINTFWAEELLTQLDPLIGQTPVFFFRRNVFAASTSTLTKAIGGPPVDKTSMILKSMTPRLSSMWGYGTKTGETIAATASEALVKFLNDGNFAHIERAAPRRETTLQAAMTSAQQNITEFRLAFDAPAPPKASSSTFGFATPASASGTRPAAPRGLHGLIEQMGLSTLLIMIEMEKKSGELVLTRENETARMYLKKGRMVAAYAEGNSVPPASRSGPEAVYFALTWTAGQFDFAAREIEMEDKINQPTTSLLMEGARRMDDAGNSNAG